MLVWTIVVLSFLLAAAILILGFLSGDFQMAMPVAAGLFAAPSASALGFYSNKAKAENEIKLSRSNQVEAPPRKPAAKPKRTPDFDALAGQISLFLQQNFEDGKLCD